MASIQGVQTDKNGAFGKVGAEPAPERVPLAGFIGSARDLQDPVPYCSHGAPSVQRKRNRIGLIVRLTITAIWHCWRKSCPNEHSSHKGLSLQKPSLFA